MQSYKYNSSEQYKKTVIKMENNYERKAFKKIHNLGIEELRTVDHLNELNGDYINLELKLTNGKTAKLLDGNKKYYGNQICKNGSDRCYGIAADEQQILICEYGDGGTDAEFVLWVKL
ncbi:MAG: hypothetical protein ACK5LP_03205 [Campylobacteraceae bacterium]